MPHAVQHLGAYATSAAGGSQGISWRGCVFQDVSAGSHMLGDVTDAVLNETDPTKWDREMLVEDCKILNIPVEFTGASGLFAGYVQSLTVQHNHFANQVMNSSLCCAKKLCENEYLTVSCCHTDLFRYDDRMGLGADREWARIEQDRSQPD